jgi:hypothetical protein
MDAHGAYGLRLEGLGEAVSSLVPAQQSWPRFELSQRVGVEALDVQTVGPDQAAIAPPSGGAIHIERDPGRATFVVPSPVSAQAIVHPLLAHVAAIAAWWAGRESLHAGAFVADGGVWALLGGRGAGKSSTLAWLAREGHDVLCDDMLVLDGNRPFAGPRSLDLRRAAAERLGEGEPLGVLGERERWRLPLAQVAELPPLRGVVALAWGDEISSRPLGGRRRIELLAANRGVRLPAPEPDAWLDLAGLSWYELERPQRWEALPAVADELRRLAG